MYSFCANIVLGIAAVWLMLGTLLTGGNGLHIDNLLVPEAVENGSKTAVILDCDYTLEPADHDYINSLVVKWYFNNDPDPVYQWIFDKKPQDAPGLFKGRLNLEYRASDVDWKMYRALQIIKPTTELSGWYKCIVSTFASEESSFKKMIIYAPGRGLQLTQERKRSEQEEVNMTIKCWAEAVFPEPNITISSRNRRLEGDPVDVDVQSRPDGLYDIAATLTVKETEEDSQNIFDCLLRIPEANYSMARSTIHYQATNTGRWLLPCSAFCTALLSLTLSWL